MIPWLSRDEMLECIEVMGDDERSLLLVAEQIEARFNPSGERDEIIHWLRGGKW